MYDNDHILLSIVNRMYEEYYYVTAGMMPRVKLKKKSADGLDGTIGSRVEEQVEGPAPESMLSKREQLRSEYICTRAMLAHRYPLGRHLIRTGAEGLAANLDLCSRCSA